MKQLLLTQVFLNICLLLLFFLERQNNLSTLSRKSSSSLGQLSESLMKTYMESTHGTAVAHSSILKGHLFFCCFFSRKAEQPFNLVRTSSRKSSSSLGQLSESLTKTYMQLSKCYHKLKS